MATENKTLYFEFTPDVEAAQLNDGYGSGVLWLNNRPFWYSNSEDTPQAVEWTWVDFLEHLAAIWPALVAEQAYPFDWLNKQVHHPREIWKCADFRWSRIADDIAEQEEITLYEFHNRHNLASGWKGMGLPALFWLRIGNSVWLSPENGTPIRADYTECKNSILEIGNKLAESFSGSNNQRVISAVNNWRNKGSALKSSFLELATGFKSSELRQIESGTSPEIFWEITGEIDWDNEPANDSAFLVAARMTRGILPPSSIAKVISKIRQTDKSKTAELDKLSNEAASFIQSGSYSYPHESGYHLAEWLRNKLNINEIQYLDVVALLSDLKVEVTNSQFGSDCIEAIAFWGGHGPCVMVNDDRAYSSDVNRLRMTLAHEICHLLLDRERTLTAAEVFGGAVDLYIERRANAFAAEFLLPRASIDYAISKVGQRLSDLLTFLCHTFSVSKSVACAQIYNSQVFPNLTVYEKEYIERRLMKLLPVEFSEKIVSEVV